MSLSVSSRFVIVSQTTYILYVPNNLTFVLLEDISIFHLAMIIFTAYLLFVLDLRRA